MRWTTKLSCDVKLCQEFWCQKLLKSDNYSSTYSQQYEWVFFLKHGVYNCIYRFGILTTLRASINGTHLLITYFAGDVSCAAKFRREFSRACRAGCSPGHDGQQNMSMPAKTSQWRTRDRIETVAGTSRRHRRQIFRFTDVMGRDDAAAATDGINPPADAIID